MDAALFGVAQIKWCLTLDTCRYINQEKYPHSTRDPCKPLYIEYKTTMNTERTGPSKAMLINLLLIIREDVR